MEISAGFSGQNYLPQQNPWNLAAPPLWWLNKLWLRDPDLVIMPGLKDPVYRVARRSPKGRSLKPVAFESETQRLWNHSLVPVTSLVPWAAWDDRFFQWLNDHDSWALKGREQAGTAAADRLDELDGMRQAAIDRDGNAMLDAVNASAYEGYKRRVGETVTLTQPATPLR